MKYTYKDEYRLAWEAGKKRLRMELTLVSDRVLNEAFTQWTDDFNDALSRGELLELDDCRKYIAQAAQRELGSGS